MATDPPYGVSYDPAWRHRVHPTQRTAVGRVLNDDRAAWAEAWRLFPGRVAYVWHAALKAAVVASDLETAGFTIRSHIIWSKTHFALSRGDYHWGHEPAWYAVRGTGHWRGDRRQTTERILYDHGIAPAPERNQRTPWKTFLQAHWEGLAAADLFTVEVLTLAGLRRYFVFFVIVLKTRRVHIAGIHPQPDGRWMEQMARNLTDPVDGFLRTARQLIHDRDPLYTRVFGEILTSGDVGPIRLPPKRPNLNAYAERFVRSIKEECLHRVVPLGEGHVRLIVHEYVEHYQRETGSTGRQIDHKRNVLLRVLAFSRSMQRLPRVYLPVSDSGVSCVAAY